MEDKYEYLPIEQAKEGDIVEYIGFKGNEPKTNSFNIGSLYILNTNYRPTGYDKAPWSHINKGYVGFVIDDLKCTTNGWGAGLFKLIKTLPGSEAKVGDEYIVTNNRGFPEDYYSEGMIFTMREKCKDNGVWAEPKPSGSHWRKDIRILCKVKKKTETFPRNKEYYEYWQAIHDADIAYEYCEDKSWVPCIFLDCSPSTDYANYRDSIKYRLSDRLPDEPEPNTQEYLDYWDSIKKKGAAKIERYFVGTSRWSTLGQLPSQSGNYALYRIKKKKVKSEDLVSKDWLLGKEVVYDENVPKDKIIMVSTPLGKDSLWDGFKKMRSKEHQEKLWNHNDHMDAFMYSLRQSNNGFKGFKQEFMLDMDLGKEGTEESADSNWKHFFQATIKENKMTAAVVEKVKTDLEASKKKKWTGVYYSLNGTYLETRSYKTEKEVTDALVEACFAGATVDVSQRKSRLKQKIDTVPA